MTFIEGYMTGNAWEELCVKCYRLRYQKEHYTAIPAVQGGDAGIEGFTQNGIVHQCYCPERVYSDNDLYAHQRDKLTADIEKLMANGDQLKRLGVPPIVEWHFKCNYQKKISEFDGVSIIDFNDQNKIISAKEYQSKSQHYYPYSK